MNSSGMQPESNESTSINSPAAKQSEASDEQLLELVLNETLAARNREQVFPLIVKFAQRNSGREVTEPIVLEALIQEILEKRLKGRIVLVECLHWIASTILDDLDSRDRLVSLWEMAKNECQ